MNLPLHSLAHPVRSRVYVWLEGQDAVSMSSHLDQSPAPSRAISERRTEDGYLYLEHEPAPLFLRVWPTREIIFGKEGV